VPLCPFCRKPVPLNAVWCACGVNLSRFPTLPTENREIKEWLARYKPEFLEAAPAQANALVEGARRQLVGNQEKAVGLAVQNRMGLGAAKELIAGFLADCRRENLEPTIDVGQLRKERWRQWKRTPSEQRQNPPLKIFKQTPGYFFQITVAKYKDTICIAPDGSLYKHQHNAPDPFPFEELLSLITVDQLGQALTMSLVELLKAKQQPDGPAKAVKEEPAVVPVATAEQPAQQPASVKQAVEQPATEKITAGQAVVPTAGLQQPPISKAPIEQPAVSTPTVPVAGMPQPPVERPSVPTAGKEQPSAPRQASSASGTGSGKLGRLAFWRQKDVAAESPAPARPAQEPAVEKTPDSKSTTEREAAAKTVVEPPVVPPAGMSLSPTPKAALEQPAVQSGAAGQPAAPKTPNPLPADDPPIGRRTPSQSKKPSRLTFWRKADVFGESTETKKTESPAAKPIESEKTEPAALLPAQAVKIEPVKADAPTPGRPAQEPTVEKTPDSKSSGGREGAVEKGPEPSVPVTKPPISRASLEEPTVQSGPAGQPAAPKKPNPLPADDPPIGRRSSAQDKKPSRLAFWRKTDAAAESTETQKTESPRPRQAETTERAAPKPPIQENLQPPSNRVENIKAEPAAPQPVKTEPAKTVGPTVAARDVDRPSTAKKPPGAKPETPIGPAAEAKPPVDQRTTPKQAGEPPAVQKTPSDLPAAGRQASYRSAGRAKKTGWFPFWSKTDEPKAPPANKPQASPPHAADPKPAPAKDAIGKKTIAPAGPSPARPNAGGEAPGRPPAPRQSQSSGGQKKAATPPDGRAATAKAPSRAKTATPEPAGSKPPVKTGPSKAPEPKPQRSAEKKPPGAKPEAPMRQPVAQKTAVDRPSVPNKPVQRPPAPQAAGAQPPVGRQGARRSGSHAKKPSWFAFWGKKDAAPKAPPQKPQPPKTQQRPNAGAAPTVIRASRPPVDPTGQPRRRPPEPRKTGPAPTGPKPPVKTVTPKAVSPTGAPTSPRPAPGVPAKKPPAAPESTRR
jgi:hypothetical protein